MPEISKVNWIICPKCQFRYQIGAAILKVEGIPAICPQCRHEFDPRLRMEQKLTVVNVRELY